MENVEIKESRLEENKTQNLVFEDLGTEWTNMAIAPTEPGDKQSAAAGILPELTLDSMADADKATLNSIYKNATAGEIPDGDTVGRAITFPGSKVGDFISNLEEKLWKGKVFDANGGLENKILGLNAVDANVYKGQSWFDGKESIIIDYKGKSLLAGCIRDEIREVSPGLYLGKMYARLPFGRHADAMFFALETKKS